MKSFLFLVLLGGAAFCQSFESTALAISRDIPARHLPFGTVLDPMYMARDSTELQTYTRCGDSAIWTGHWLAAEAFRYAVTRSPEAFRAADLALLGMEKLTEVTGELRLLARCVVDPASPYAAGPRDEEKHHREYTGNFRGVNLIWFGNTSRDQYMGVFFGLSVAYEQIPEPSFRARISAVATKLIDRLLENEWAVVMPGRGISTVFWHRPDQQLAILQVGRQVNPTRFRSRYEERRQSLVGLTTVLGLESREEHGSYFKFNLNAITLYTLVRLEEREAAGRSEYLDAYNLHWRAVSDHGNAFFNTIDRALRGADAARDARTARLLQEWLERGRRDDWVDLRGKYKACGSDEACEVIPVPERVRTDFLWQRSPFLLYGGGEGRIETAGIDFILPYWMDRFYAGPRTAIVSAASGSTAIAPGSIATLYGVEPGTQVTLTDSTGARRQARILYSGREQVNFLIPAETAPGPVTVEAGSLLTSAEVLANAPALFSANASGTGVAAATAMQQAGSTYTSVPVFSCESGTCAALPLRPETQRPVLVSLYGTGLRNAANSVRVTLGGEPLPVLFAGPHPEFAGLDQINVQIDTSVVSRGELDVVVSTSDRASNPVRLLLVR
ncbi:MAG TPA: hypothetical protein VES20_01510 [Bryobacteraceae bacterium]|nr:hypothetical protein [Bryobacteraceae bacterium]